MMAQPIFLCRSEALVDGGLAVCFDVLFGAESQPAFAVRYGGQVHAYLNRCTHVPMTMDFLPGQFFDSTGQWLICATHGALFEPETGQCRGGPCRGSLLKIALHEADGVVYWHTSEHVQPLFPDT